MFGTYASQLFRTVVVQYDLLTGSKTIPSESDLILVRRICLGRSFEFWVLSSELEADKNSETREIISFPA